LAEGGGDLYVRRGPTSEWDTAAGQAVVLEAGGCVVDQAGQPLRYNVRDTVTNPSFIVYGDRTRDWVALLGGL
jgi:3'(2'), 5'-bisphosphate nucleotidase